MASKETTGIGISGLTLLWGIITQALKWAGVLDWPWLACWGPFMIVCAGALIIILIVVLILLVRKL